MINKRLGDILEFQRGFDLPSQKRKNGSYPIISSSGISGYHSAWKLDGENVITGRYGTIGEVYYYNGRCWALNTALFVKDFKSNSAKYIYYLLQFIFLNIHGNDKSTVPGVNRNDLHELVVPFCENKNMQDSLVSILTKIDRKISLNNAVIAELEKVAKMLYDYWFVQFDFPNAEGKPYRTSGGEMIWSDELKREIPKEWEVKTLFDLASISTGDKDANFATPNGKYKFFTCSKDTFLCDVTEFNGQAILLAGNGDFNVKHYTGEFNAYQRTYVIQPKSATHYSTIYFATSDKINTLKRGSNGSIVKFITMGDVTSIALPVCKNNALYFELNKYIIAIEKTEQQNIELTALRNFLLPLLINGQVTVTSVEAVAPITESIPTPTASDTKERKSAVFKRLVLSAYILDNICDEPTTGRVKFEKLLFLSEHCAQLPFNSEFHRAAAGPYDPQALYGIESQLQKNKWFMHKKVKGESRAYTRLEKSDGYKSYLGTSFDTKQAGVIDELIRLFKSARTIQCEIVATLYGAWNDFLIDGIKPTDKQIVDEVLTNWHERKERIERDRWLTALGWMRKNDIVPTGYGVSTKRDRN